MGGRDRVGLGLRGGRGERTRGWGHGRRRGVGVGAGCVEDAGLVDVEAGGGLRGRWVLRERTPGWAAGCGEPAEGVAGRWGPAGPDPGAARGRVRGGTAPPRGSGGGGTWQTLPSRGGGVSGAGWMRGRVSGAGGGAPRMPPSTAPARGEGGGAGAPGSGSGPNPAALPSGLRAPTGRGGHFKGDSSPPHRGYGAPGHAAASRPRGEARAPRAARAGVLGLPGPSALAPARRGSRSLGRAG